MAISRLLLLWALPVLFIVLGVPLILQWVPPNGLYGVRIPASFTSPEAWYRINRVGGYLLIVAGVLAFIVNMVIGRFVHESSGVVEPLLMVGTNVVLVITATIAIVVMAPKL